LTSALRSHVRADLQAFGEAPAPKGPAGSPLRRKRPQSCAALKFFAPDDDKVRMTVTTPPLPRSARQLVFTSSQAAVYLGVSLATIRRWTDAGHISCYRTPGGQRRFSREQLDGFIASMQRGGGEDRPEIEIERSARRAS
jgi:excisionase family DNA binding protein